MCNDYKARKVCCAAFCVCLLSAALGHACIAGDSRPAASVSAAAIQLKDASHSAATTATASITDAATSIITGTTDAAAGTDVATAASGRCLWRREPPAESQTGTGPVSERSDRG